jgi:phosphoserine phosphatase RsbU/P
VVVDDLSGDPRFAHVRNTRLRHGSLVVVPLLSHGGMIGILYATKEAKFGFVKDDVEVISAFADQATIAVENSRLIKKSLERERLLRDMLVAQEMQKKLLPQSVPTRPMLEIDAVSTPAFEVGGDYYDFVELPGDRIGIIVGDVSGKGVPAAFYMSVVKGVFQALGKTCGSPRDFMIKANEALAGTIDKHSFVSLIYGIVDVRSATLTLARAGHCPLLHLGASGVEYIRPNGMGVGLSGGPIFDGAIEERIIPLGEGDVCVFYTDGITEARAGDEEYGYERLLEAARTSRTSSAPAICRGILDSVKAFAQDPASNDDLTLVVLKWIGSRN